jgi:hypothetical protein
MTMSASRYKPPIQHLTPMASEPNEIEALLSYFITTSHPVCMSLTEALALSKVMAEFEKRACRKVEWLAGYHEVHWRPFQDGEHMLSCKRASTVDLSAL